MEFVRELDDLLFIVTLTLTVLYFTRFAMYSKAYRIFSWYLLAMATVEWALRIVLIYDLNDTNSFLFVYFFIAQFIILSLFYRELLGYKWINFVTIGCLFFFGIQYILEPDLLLKYNPIGASVAQGIVVVYSLLYFYKLLSEKGEFVLVNIAIFFFLICSMLIFATGNLMVDKFISDDFAWILQDLHFIFYFIFIGLVTVEWFKNYRRISLK